jgi:hypothetical protein
VVLVDLLCMCELFDFNCMIIHTSSIFNWHESSVCTHIHQVERKTPSIFVIVSLTRSGSFKWVT